MTVCAVYFVASPLQLMVAEQLARTHEAGARQVLVWYQPGVGPCVRAQDWDASVYMPWPRLQPLPGPWGRLRRARANIKLVADRVGRCEVLHLHSAVFDTEAINYFLRALPRLCGAHTMHARILPDGLISIRRYPLNAAKRLIQQFRRLRRLIAPELDYWPFAGDRIGSDAPFCDRIYVVPGLPHEYPPHKVVTLQPLLSAPPAAAIGARRALVIDQKLVESGRVSAADMGLIGATLRRWLAEQGITQVVYKPHPKDTRRDLWREGDAVVDSSEPLERWMAHEHFDAVAGIRSTGLLFARQLYDAQTVVAGFGWERVAFKSDAERADMAHAFTSCGVLLLPAT
jgi:Alpha-2,8-polysialyltransferase (POLYST)